MEDFFNNIKESFTNAVLEFETINIKVDSTQWIETHEQLRDEFNLKFFSWLSAVDWDNDVSVGEAPKESVTPCFELITCLSDVENTNLITVSTTIDKSEPQIDSLVEIYEGANWHEREAYEMFGISFANHPNLEKLYLPDGYEQEDKVFQDLDDLQNLFRTFHMLLSHASWLLHISQREN